MHSKFVGYRKNCILFENVNLVQKILPLFNFERFMYGYIQKVLRFNKLLQKKKIEYRGSTVEKFQKIKYRKATIGNNKTRRNKRTSLDTY